MAVTQGDESFQMKRTHKYNYTLIFMGIVG